MRRANSASGVGEVGTPGVGHSVPSPIVPEARRRHDAGEGRGGGDGRTSAVGTPPTPNPSPQGGGKHWRRKGRSVPSPIVPEARLRHDVGEGQGGGDGRTSAVGIPPSPPGGSGIRSARARPGERTARLWAKAQVAAQSARLLIESGDSDGAVNRAYYAVFGAARAALAAVRSSLAVSKRHGTIYRRFDKHLVQERGFDPALGRRFLSKQRRARHDADYEEGRVEETVARAVLGDMDRFLAAVAPLLKTVKQ